MPHHHNLSENRQVSVNNKSATSLKTSFSFAISYSHTHAHGSTHSYAYIYAYNLASRRDLYSRVYLLVVMAMTMYATNTSFNPDLGKARRAAAMIIHMVENRSSLYTVMSNTNDDKVCHSSSLCTNLVIENSKYIRIFDIKYRHWVMRVSENLSRGKQGPFYST